MKKVTITITENGFETKVELGEKTFVEKTEIAQDGIVNIKGNFEHNNNIKDNLFFSLEMCSAECFGIAEALLNYK